MRSTRLTLIAGALLVSSFAVASHDGVHPGAKHRMVLQVRQEPSGSTSAPAVATPSTSAAPVVPTTATSATREETSAAPTSASPTTTSAAPTTTSAAPTTTSAAPTTTSAAPTTTSAAPTTTSAAPTTTSAAPTTTSAAPTTTSAVGPVTLSKATTSDKTSTVTLPGLVSAVRTTTTAKSSASAGTKNANAKESSGIGKGATVGIVIGVLVGVAALAFFLFRKFKLAKTKKFNRRLQPLDFSAGGMPDEHEFKTTEGAFAGGEKRGDSDWERRERERSDLVDSLDHNDPAYTAGHPGVPAHDFTAAYPSYPPQSDAYGYPPQGAYGAGNGYEDQHHPTSYYGDNMAGFGAAAPHDPNGAGVQRQPSNGGQYDQGAYGQHDQYMGAYDGQQDQYGGGVQRQPSGGAAAYDSYGQHNYANTTDYPPQQPHQQAHQGQGGAY